MSEVVENNLQFCELRYPTCIICIRKGTHIAIEANVELRYRELLQFTSLNAYTSGNTMFVFNQSKSVPVNKDQFKPYCSCHFIFARIYS